ncbi:hypothetical protein [Solidesulfovibrio carbinoliphilus]|uniref:hypothetical protein n=1 Tax=Solidesulfovibrio carbinoliphilus TaxID=345370 RepID=UPI0001C24295|nr:hypothetical protein [Solidesulfovibrio carbinoliphilus]
MKLFALVIACAVLFSSFSYADEVSKEARQNSENAQNPQKSPYKASPRLSYGSNKPDKDDNGLGNLKPMLDQTFGNNKDGVGGGVMPNAGTYKF